jgi:glycolate oxidase iron-sulfur subunit
MATQIDEARPTLEVHKETKSVFDAHHPPPVDLIEDCVHCGFCLPTCPTYLLWGEEMDSPRGRIYLMKLGHEGKARWSETYVGHFDKCLGCMACLTACPSGVQYDKLIEATRAQIERNYPRSFADKIFRRMLFEIFPYPLRLRFLAAPLWIYQATGLRALVERTGLVRLLPARLQAMESLLPTISFASLYEKIPEVTPAVGEKRARVGLLLGCVQRVFFRDVNSATVRVLAAEGCEVFAPKNQSCCGALMTHAGEERDALELARHTIDVFERANLDAVIINAAGCGSNVKEYGWLLRDDPNYAERARAFAAKCKDVSEFLAELEPRAIRHPLKLKVAYHDACHLQHAQRITMQPRKLLQGIPELEILEINEAAICCGSAGIYNMIQPDAAQELGARKAQNVIETGADILATSNPGCLLQIRNALRAAGSEMPVTHIVELLDASIDGGCKLGTNAS